MEPIAENDLYELAARLGALLQEKAMTITTAESCTGGWVAQAITSKSGSSAWFERGFVTYSNEAKQEILGVSADTLAVHGAVSAETALAMATGACRIAKAGFAVAVTGIAGPTGGTAGKPVGLVWFGFCAPGRDPLARSQVFSGDRREIRAQAVRYALSTLLELITVAPARQP